MPAAALLMLLALCAPDGRPVVTEVVYDAAGDDTGHEFVEIHNPSAAAVALLGVRLEAGDGSQAGRWTLRWTGGVADTVRPGARFVIGGALVSPPPDARVTLDLQNGPDAVRLVWPDGHVEIVGWGAHEFDGYACGDPGPDVTPPLGLARLPDEARHGSNALDFAGAVPTPGQANRARRDAALRPGSIALAPLQPDPLTRVTVSTVVMNAGSLAIEPGALAVAWAWEEGDSTLAPPLAEVLAPGDSAAIAFAIDAPAAGPRRLHAQVVLAGDERTGNDADTLRVRVGPGPLALREIQFHPRAGEGEWVEVENRDDVPLDLARFRLSDRGATRATPSGGATLAPGALAVLAQDRAALLAHFPGLDPARVWEAAPWPALNNTNDTSGTADAVVLREDDGTPVSRVDYSATAVPDGVPLEWRDGGWWPSLAADGTPLAAPRLIVARGGFEVVPRRWRAGGPPPRLAWVLPFTTARVSAELYDLAGRRVARPLHDRPSASHGEWTWSGPPPPPGVYAVVLRARGPQGESVAETRALRIEGEAP